MSFRDPAQAADALSVERRTTKISRGVRKRVTATESTTVDPTRVLRNALTGWQHSSSRGAVASDLLTLHQEVAALKPLSVIRLSASFS